MSGEDAADLGAIAAPGGRGVRPAQPEPFLRGLSFQGVDGVPYPRADAGDRMRLPLDTWMMAKIPAGVRLEITGDAAAVAVDYETATEDLGYRGKGAGTTFVAHAGGGGTTAAPLAQEPAVLGAGTVELPLAAGDRTIVYLPEGMRPTVTALRGVGGEIAPAARQPRWVIYGDSVAEGWIASEPARAWPARAGRLAELDTVNLGYAGAARAEIASAEQMATLPADVLTVCHGTNCWTRIPHSAALFRAGFAAFLDILRGAHPTTPLLVVSPVVRPDAEETPNRLGATLADLRDEMEAEAEARRAAGDDRLALVRGGELITAGQLGDGIHPDDSGHAAMAEAIAAAVTDLLRD